MNGHGNYLGSQAYAATHADFPAANQMQHHPQDSLSATSTKHGHGQLSHHAVGVLPSVLSKSSFAHDTDRETTSHHGPGSTSTLLTVPSNDQAVLLQTLRERLTESSQKLAAYTRLEERLRGLVDRPRWDAMVPISSKASFLGQLVHTNTITVHMGEDWYVEYSAAQAADILKRRREDLSTEAEELRSKIDDSRKRLAKELGLEKGWEIGDQNEVLNEEGLPVFEIREDVEESAMPSASLRPSIRVNIKERAGAGGLIYKSSKRANSVSSAQAATQSLKTDVLFQLPHAKPAGMSDLTWAALIASDEDEETLKEDEHPTQAPATEPVAAPVGSITSTNDPPAGSPVGERPSTAPLPPRRLKSALVSTQQQPRQVKTRATIDKGVRFDCSVPAHKGLDSSPITLRPTVKPTGKAILLPAPARPVSEVVVEKAPAVCVKDADANSYQKTSPFKERQARLAPAQKSHQEGIVTSKILLTSPATTGSTTSRIPSDSGVALLRSGLPPSMSDIPVAHVRGDIPSKPVAFGDIVERTTSKSPLQTPISRHAAEHKPRLTLPPGAEILQNKDASGGSANSRLNGEGQPAQQPISVQTLPSLASPTIANGSSRVLRDESNNVSDSDAESSELYNSDTSDETDGLGIDDMLMQRQIALEYHRRRQDLGAGQGTGPLGGNGPAHRDKDDWNQEFVPIDANLAEGRGVRRTQQFAGVSRFLNGRLGGRNDLLDTTQIIVPVMREDGKLHLPSEVMVNEAQRELLMKRLAELTCPSQGGEAALIVEEQEPIYPPLETKEIYSQIDDSRTSSHARHARNVQPARHARHDTAVAAKQPEMVIVRPSSHAPVGQKQSVKDDVPVAPAETTSAPARIKRVSRFKAEHL